MLNFIATDLVQLYTIV